MAVAYQSQQTASGTTAGADLTITKPTSLAVGDLMMVFLWGRRNTGDWSTLSGWTKIGSASNSDGTDSNLTVLGIVATSTETAASDFSFTPNANHEEKFGLLMRVTGDFSGGIGSLIVSDFDSDATSNAGISSGITPIAASSLLIMATGYHAAPTTSVSNYAVANNNPTWTERADGTKGSSVYMDYALATATFSPATATGNYSFDISGGAATCSACLVSISESTDLSVTGDTGIISMQGKEGTVAAEANVSGAVGTLNMVGNEGTVSAGTSKWTNKNKSDTSPTITNKNKS